MIKKLILAICRFFERLDDARADHVSEGWLKEHRYTAEDPNPRAATKYEQC